MKCAKRTDFRVKIMNEILHGIQVIKMYGWEKSFAKMIDRIRKWVVSNSRIPKIQAFQIPKPLISEFFPL